MCDIYTEKIDGFHNVTLTIELPEYGWELIKQSEEWNEVKSMINKVQQTEDTFNAIMGEKDKKNYCIKYEDIPLMHDTVQRIDDLHKRILVGLALPVVALIISVVALILALA